MKVEETIRNLREYNKWRHGKGKKYQGPVPIDVSLTIDNAIAKLSAYRKVCKVIEDSNKDVASH